MVSIDSFIDFFILYSNELWFIDGKNNGLFRTKNHLKDVEFVCSIPSKKNDLVRMYNAGVAYEDKLVFCPYNSESVLFFNTISEEFHAVKVAEDLAGKAQFSNAILCGKELIMVDSYKAHVLAIINLEDETVELFSFDNLCKKESVLCRDLVHSKGKIYMACLNEPIIITFDIATKELSKAYISKAQGFGTIIDINDVLWLTDHNNIFRVGLNETNEEEYDRINLPCCDQTSNTWGQRFFRSFYYKEDIVFVSSTKTELQIFDTSLCTLNEVAIQKDVLKNTEIKRYSSLPYLGICIEKNFLYLYSTLENAIIVFDLDKQEEVNKMPFCISDEARINGLIGNNEIIKEDKTGDLGNLLRYIEGH